MGIKVCHNKFNNIVSKILFVFSQIFKYGLISLFFIGIVQSFLTPIVESPIPGDPDFWDKFKESNSNRLQWFFNFIMMLIGGVTILYHGFIIPRFDDRPNYLQRFNKKIQLFEWREDC